MEFRELVEKRVSVRRFLPDPVEPAHITEMIRIAGLAPSPNNTQPWRFVAVTRPSLCHQMADAVRAALPGLIPEPKTDEARQAKQRVEWFSTFFGDAPLVIAVVSLPYETVIQHALGGGTVTAAQVNAMRNHPDIQSVGAAIEHILLAAVDLGYGGCWLSSPLVARETLEHLLGIDAPGRLAGLLAIGKPAATPTHRRDRLSVDEILRVID
jgi:nitroreductase